MHGVGGDLKIEEGDEEEEKQITYQGNELRYRFIPQFTSMVRMVQFFVMLTISTF